MEEWTTHKVSRRGASLGSRWAHTVLTAIVLLALLSFGVVAAVAAQTTTTSTSSSATNSTASTPAYTVGVAQNATLGNYLINGAGFTLYYFANDTVGTATSPPVSACTTALSCVAVWPPFYASNIVVAPGSGLSASDFTTFTRSDGSNQTAYMGHPLYLFIGDRSPGQTTGNALRLNGGLWYVALTSGVVGTTSSSTTSTSTSTTSTTASTTSSTTSSTTALSPAAMVALTVAASMALMAVALGSRLRGSRRGTTLYSRSPSPA
ncbi:MAG: hypothetical protein JRN09_03515 [Nitrososphaerota archaeon]|nr:hypothetical protein [Nitrososphaerota archaeon]